MVYRDGFGNIKQDMVMERDPANLHRKVEHIECQLADLRKENERLQKVNDEYAETAEEKYDHRTRLEKAEAGMHDKCSCVGCSLQYTAECVPYCKLLTAVEGLSDAPVPHNDNAR